MSIYMEYDDSRDKLWCALLFGNGIWIHKDMSMWAMFMSLHYVQFTNRVHDPALHSTPIESQGLFWSHGKKWTEHGLTSSILVPLSQGSATRGSGAACGSLAPRQWLPEALREIIDYSFELLLILYLTRKSAPRFPSIFQASPGEQQILMVG